MTLVALAAAGTVLSASIGLGDARRWQAAARTRQRLLPAAAPPALPVPAGVRRAFHRAGLAGEADRLIVRWALALLLIVALSVAVPSARILLALTLVGGPAGLAVAGGRVDRRRSAQLPEALDAVAAGLRSGLALPAAIAGAASVGAPLGHELAAIARDVEAGRPLADAVVRWQVDADPHTVLAGAALTVAATVGGPGARAVDGAAASLRDRIGSEAEARALATQGRASAAVLTLAPLAFALLLSSLDPAAGRFLLGTPVGWLCIVAGLLLDAVGAFWMARLVRRAG